MSLELDKAEWLKDIMDGSSSLKAFLALAGESISERESKRFEEGLNTKVKLTLYKTFGKAIEFKKYLGNIKRLLVGRCIAYTSLNVQESPRFYIFVPCPEWLCY